MSWNEDIRAKVSQWVSRIELAVTNDNNRNESGLFVKLLFWCPKLTVWGGIILFLGMLIYGLWGYIARQAAYHDNPANWEYSNFKATIVGINGSEYAQTKDKFVNPRMLSIVLFKIEDSRYKDAYFKMCHGTDDIFGNALLTDAWIYNHSIGDTVTFRFIGSKRVFKINKKN